MRIGIDASRAFVAEPTGTERYSHEVITRLLELPEAKQHEWILYTKFPIFKYQFPNNVQVTQIPMKYLWTQVGLAMRTWMDGLDVLWVPAHTLPALRKLGIKTVVTIHGLEYEWLPAYENLLQRWYLPLSTRYAVLGARKIIAVSEFTKRQLVERLGASPAKIEVVYEGITESRRVEEHESKRILKKFKLKNKKYILFIGTVQPRKNLERLIEAFSSLGPQESDISLVIAGKLGWGYKEILAAPNRFGVEGRVVFTGYISDVERYTLLANARVYVQPSITEGFGLPVLEAMGAKVPVASSNGGALVEVVGDAGLLFDPYVIEDMKNKIELAMRRGKLITKGLKRARNFDWKKASLKTYNILTKF
jgi:glycosyltransferase involved in cell wall biosynthesis